MTLAFSPLLHCCPVDNGQMAPIVLLGILLVTQSRVLWEEGISMEELPQSDCSVVESVRVCLD